MHTTKDSFERFIHWKEDWSVGNYEIDEQHKTIITLINLLTDSDYSLIKKHTTLPQTLEYIKMHLDYEEKLMHEINYIGLQEHKKSHKDLYNKTNNLLTDNIVNHKTIKEMADFLKSWWLNHFLTEDAKLRPFFSEYK